MRGGKRENAGRPKGAQNKETKALRERISLLLDDNWDQFLNDIKKLSEKERVDTVIKILDFALPRLNKVEMKDVTSLEDFVAMTPEERRKRIIELKRQLHGES